MSLHTLPTEILRKIFLFFHDLEVSLASVVRVCWRLHDIVEPILYQVVRIEDPSALGGFMRAFIRRPELVEYVKSFDSPTAPAERFQEVKMFYDTLEQRKRLRDTLPDNIYGGQRCDQWLHNLRPYFIPAGNYSATVGFLLNLVAPRLEHLVLRTGGYSPFVQEVAEQAAKTEETFAATRIFPNLRSVRFDHLENIQDLIPVEFVLPYLKLGSVVCLSVDGLQDRMEPLYREKPDPLSGREACIDPINWHLDTFQV